MSLALNHGNKAISWLGLSKPIRDSTHSEDPIGTDPKPADLTIPAIGDGSSPPKTDSDGSISVSTPKNLKKLNRPEKNPYSGEKPKFQLEIQIPARKILKTSEKNLDIG